MGLERVKKLEWIREIAENGLGLSDHPDNWRHARYCAERNPEGFGCECGLSKMRTLVNELKRVASEPGKPDLNQLLVDQVKALLLLIRAGGDIRTANLDDRLFTDRLQDTLDAIQDEEP